MTRSTARCGLAWLATLALVLAAGLGSAVAAAEPRLALVVGGASEAGAPTAAADAGLVAEALAQDGFDVTAIRASDADAVGKGAALFADKLRRAGGTSLAFVYVSGCGVQSDGANYLVPTGAHIAHQTDVPGQAVALAEIMRPIEALPARDRLFVFDLARDGPVAKDDAMPLAPGLALVHPPQGSLYAFNAAPGQLAPPDPPPYGLYARALAEMLRTPAAEIGDLFSRVRLRVTQMSGGADIPWDAGDRSGPPLLRPAKSSGTPPLVDRSIEGMPVEAVFWAAIADDSLTGDDTFLYTFPDDRLAPRVKALRAARIEALTWAAAVQADTPSGYWTYMLRYPRGPHYVDVRRRLAAIHAPLAPPPRFDVFDFSGVPMPPPEGARDAQKADAAPIPAMPADILPLPPAAIYAALPPPQLVPAGALPIALPLPALPPEAAPVEPGRILQPFVPSVGPVSIEPGEGTTLMTFATPAGVLSRTIAKDEPAARTVLQTDPANRVQSRTRTTREPGLVTIVQTGPTGGILVKMVTTTAADGARTTTTINGANQMVAEVQADRAGVETRVTFGGSPLTAPPLAILPPESAHVVPAAPAAPAEPPQPPKREPLTTDESRSRPSR